MSNWWWSNIKAKGIINHFFIPFDFWLVLHAHDQVQLTDKKSLIACAPGWKTKPSHMWTRRYSSKKHAAARNHHLNNFVALHVDFFVVFQMHLPGAKVAPLRRCRAPWLGGSLHLMKAQNKSQGPVLLNERRIYINVWMQLARCCTRRKENAFVCASLSRAECSPVKDFFHPVWHARGLTLIAGMQCEKWNARIV